MTRRKWTNKRSISADGLPPMYRFLNGVDENGEVWPRYHQQWQTYAKAQKLGYLDGEGCLTQEGANYLARQEKDKEDH